MGIPIPNPGQYPPTMSCTKFSARNSFEDQLFVNEIYAIVVHVDVIKWKHFLRNWPFVGGIHWSPVNSQHKGQWCGALMFSLIFVWINDWVNNLEAGEWRRRRGHYDVTVISDRSKIKALEAIFPLILALYSVGKRSSSVSSHDSRVFARFSDNTSCLVVNRDQYVPVYGALNNSALLCLVISSSLKLAKICLINGWHGRQQNEVWIKMLHNCIVQKNETVIPCSTIYFHELAETNGLLFSC